MALFKNKTQKRIFTECLLLFLGNILFFLTVWLMNKYDKVFFDQVLYQMKSSSAGVHRDLAGSAVIHVGLFSIIVTSFEIMLYRLLSGRIKKLLRRSRKYIYYSTSKICTFFKNRSMLISAVSFAVCFIFCVTKLDVFAYIETVSQKSNFIDNHYIHPNNAEISFPEEKRNVIYIFTESMENTFADTSAGGKIHENYIPELSRLAKENISFSNTDNIGGAMSFSGTTWTAAAMVSQTCGVPIKVSATANTFGEDDIFMSGVVSIGDILKKEGYNQTLLLGSDSEFHGRKQYFKRHGNYDIVDTTSLKKSGRLSEDYRKWWGFEDEKLFQYAKEELMRLSSDDKPFNLTMLTADTHFPDGYVCRLCDNKYDEQYANVLSCSSKQIYDFVSWVQNQPFYENTTIIISGDHLTMDAEFLEDIDEKYIRTTYNCIINSAIPAKNRNNRVFASFDMFPTTLAAMGAEIEGNRLGLGTNLFSDEKTLAEQYGAKKLNTELQKKSEFYNTKLLKLE